VGTHRESGYAAASTTRGDDMNFDSDSIDGYAVPVDPMDLLQCDSCQ
jgi:hypothetical protein